MIPVSMVVYWMMIFWLKQNDTCVNSGLLNDDILIKTKCVNSGLLNDDILIKKMIPGCVNVVYWMMILWLKQMYLEIKTKWYLTNVSMVVYWMMIFWLKQSDTCVNGR